MSHPDPMFDPDNAYEDDIENSGEIDWHDEVDDSMDGDHDSAMRDVGWGTDEDYGHYGDDIDAFHDYYGEDY